ncbi:hypothetical protein KFK09_004494 [Dendrobium nobile]|uniref:Uncharacterized protein n=1 Tax=Dendrobium nobile TaxID=94219 RepID=A0A8T3C2Y5_DENNO|nr:hypothetical protein KFK09_004494 [Dendrobium nobile]
MIVILIFDEGLALYSLIVGIISLLEQVFATEFFWGISGGLDNDEPCTTPSSSVEGLRATWMC